MATILDKYQRGKLVKQIAFECNCCAETVSAIAKRYGLRPRKDRPFSRHYATKDIVMAYKNGDLIRDISQRFDCDQSTVMRIARRYQLPRRHKYESVR